MQIYFISLVTFS